MAFWWDRCGPVNEHFAWIAEEAWSLEDTLATLTARFHKKVLLDMYVWTDDRDSRRHIIYVRSFGFDCFFCFFLN